MARARHSRLLREELWAGVNKVEALGEEQQDHRFRKVPNDADCSKRHSRKVAVPTYKHEDQKDSAYIMSHT